MWADLALLDYPEPRETEVKEALPVCPELRETLAATETTEPLESEESPATPELPEPLE